MAVRCVGRRAGLCWGHGGEAAQSWQRAAAVPRCTLRDSVRVSRGRSCGPVLPSLHVLRCPEVQSAPIPSGVPPAGHPPYGDYGSERTLPPGQSYTASSRRECQPWLPSSKPERGRSSPAVVPLVRPWAQAGQSQCLRKEKQWLLPVLPGPEPDCSSALEGSLQASLSMDLDQALSGGVEPRTTEDF